MEEIEDLQAEAQIHMVEKALEGTKHIRKNLQSLISHRERTYYKFMLLSLDWMRLMKHYFELKSGIDNNDPRIFQDIRMTSPEVLVRILRNIEFICRVGKKNDDGRIELYRKNFRLFEQHWWKAENFWNNERPALIYRRENKLNMKGANWYFHGRFSFIEREKPLEYELVTPKSETEQKKEAEAEEEDDDW